MLQPREPLHFDNISIGPLHDQISVEAMPRERGMVSLINDKCHAAAS